MSVQVIILLVLPLLGAFVSFFTRPAKYSFIGTALSMLVVAIYTVCLLGTDFQERIDFEWIPSVNVGWHLDRLALLLIALVAAISLLVHIFSISYMEKDEARHRYFAFLGFFCFSMIGLLVADHLILVFVFWELVGFSSYLLIGFWWQQEENAFAARYAFITNRIADVALFSGILWMIQGIGIGSLSQLQSASELPLVVSLLLVIGAFGKSAQGPFFTWLPRAMAGPTPVSALIHAATMVAAGVYLLIRLSPVLAADVQLIVAIIGGLTALIAAISALTSYDIKGVLAYSTISQLGYMVMGVGTGAPEASFFHLWTHAFFKAGLFLSVGAVIHYMHYIGHHKLAQDMRAMGGICKQLPIVFYGYTICMLALAGLPFFTGFLSKEAIILQTIVWAQDYQIGFLLPFVALLTAFLTAFYIFRQWLYVFFGQYRGEHLAYHFIEEAPLKIPVILLAMGSIFFWYTWNPIGRDFAFLGYAIGEYPMNGAYGWLTPVSILLAVGGAAFGYYRYHGLKDQKESVEVIRDEFDRSRKGILSLSFNAFFVDWFYTRVLSVAFIAFCKRLFIFDKKWIDGFINAVGVFTVLVSKAADLIDKILVDGIVNLLAGLQVWIGNMIRLFHASRVQLHFFWAVILLVLVVIGFEIF
ncbi:MAG: NADH-quinone oxidoreductase subunit L [Cyclobacteriaceae bacterium]